MVKPENYLSFTTADELSWWSDDDDDDNHDDNDDDDEHDDDDDDDKVWNLMVIMYKIYKNFSWWRKGRGKRRRR